MKGYEAAIKKAKREGLLPLLPRWWNLSHEVPMTFQPQHHVRSSQLLNLSSFQQRLRQVGAATLYTGNGQRTKGKPIVDLPLIIEGTQYHFLLTARPYTSEELGVTDSQPALEQALEQKLSAGGTLADIHHPHIRGFYAGLHQDDIILYYDLDAAFLKERHPRFYEALDDALESFESKHGYKPLVHTPKGSLKTTAEEVRTQLAARGLVRGNNGELTPTNTFLYPGADKQGGLPILEEEPAIVGLDGVLEQYERYQASPREGFLACVPLPLPGILPEGRYAPLLIGSYAGPDKSAGVYNYGLFLGLDDQRRPSRVRFDAFLGHDRPLNSRLRDHPQRRYEPNQNARFAKKVSSELSDLLGFPVGTILHKARKNGGYRLVPVDPDKSL